MVIRELLIGLGFDVDQSKLNQADQGLEKLKSHASSVIGTVGKLAAIVGVVLGAREIIQAADEWTNMYSRIGLVTKSTEEQAAMQEKVFAIAQKTRQEYGSTADLYVKMARNSKELGATQQDVLDATETVNKALVIGGASTTEAKSTILQLGQALASGRLAGDELRSLSENAPLLFQAIADYYGVTIGKLKDMGAQGELTAEGVFKAILKAKSKMDKEFSKMPVTVAQSVTYAMNRIGKLIFNLNKETSVFQAIAGGIIRSADWIGNKIEWLSKKVGGYGNMMRTATILVAAFSAALVAIKWTAIVEGIALLKKALAVFFLSPVGWKFLAIAAAVIAVALALEDVYGWINGKDSAIGDWLGSWDEFGKKAKATLDPLIQAMSELSTAIEKALVAYNEIKAALGGKKTEIWDIPPDAYLSRPGIAGKPNYGERYGAKKAPPTQSMGIAGSQYAESTQSSWTGIIDSMAQSIRIWTQLLEGDFSGAFQTSINYLENLEKAVSAIFSSIGNKIRQWLRSQDAEFESTLQGWIAEIESSFNSAMAQANSWIESLKNGFFGAIDSIIRYFKNLLNEALSVLQQIANAIGRFVLDKISQAKSSLLDFFGLGNAPAPVAGGNNNPSPAAPPPYPSTPGVTAGGFANGIANRQITQTITQQVSIEQNIAGSNLQPAAIGNSTANATTDAIDKMTRDWQFAM